MHTALIKINSPFFHIGNSGSIQERECRDKPAMERKKMAHYYGVIVNTASRDTEMIEGDHDHKPQVEHAGWFGSCHWFLSEIAALTFQLEVEKIFVAMIEKDGKRTIFD